MPMYYDIWPGEDSSVFSLVGLSQSDSTCTTGHKKLPVQCDMIICTLEPPEALQGWIPSGILIVNESE